MTGLSKDIILGLVQSSVEDYVQFYKFPQLLRSLLAYDEEYIGTDWDDVDALAYAKMRIEDMRTRPRRNDEYYVDETEPEWVRNEDGAIVLKYVPDDKPKQGPPEKKDEKANWTQLDYQRDVAKDYLD